MKYVLFLCFAVILARIDVVFSLFTKATDSIAKKTAPSTTVPADLVAPETIPIKEDLSLNQTPRSMFFTLIDDFHVNPDADIRIKAIEVLRKHPTILGPKIDKVFEGEIFKMTDLIYNNSKELPLFLVDLTSLLVGENLEMVKRFFTILLDHDVEKFLMAYARTKDTNCMIANTMGFKVPEEELLNELIERDQLMTQYLNRSKADPAIISLGKRCQMVLQLEITKLTPFAPDAEQPEAPPAEAPTP